MIYVQKRKCTLYSISKYAYGIFIFTNKRKYVVGLCHDENLLYIHNRIK